MHLYLATSSLSRHLISVRIFNVSCFLARVWTSIHAKEVLSMVIFEAFWIRWLSLAWGFASSCTTALTNCEPFLQIINLCCSSLILNSVFVDQSIQLLVSVQVLIMFLIVRIVTSMLVFFQGSTRLPQWSFGLDWSASTGWGSFPTSFTALFTTALILELGWHQVCVMDSLVSLDRCIHLISFAMGCGTQSLFEILIFALEVICNVFSWI